MRYLTVTSVGLAAVMLVGAPAYTKAEDTTEKPSTMEQKADEAGSKVKSMAKEAKTNVSDSWVTSKTKIALFADERVKGRQISVETKNGQEWNGHAARQGRLGRGQDGGIRGREAW